MNSVSRRGTFGLACALVCFAMGTAVEAQSTAGDALTGTWSGDWGPSVRDRNTVTVALKWDGKVLTGSVNPGENAIELKSCTFDATTGAVHMKADAKNRRGADIHYTIDGKVEGDAMAGSWNHDNRKGDFKITRK